MFECANHAFKIDGITASCVQKEIQDKTKKKNIYLFRAGKIIQLTANVTLQELPVHLNYVNEILKLVGLPEDEG